MIAALSIAPGGLPIFLPPLATACASLVSLPGLFEHEPVPLKYSRRLVLAGIMLMMLALTACSAAMYRWLTPNPPQLVAREAVYDDQALAAQTMRLKEPLVSGNYRVTLGSAEPDRVATHRASGGGYPGYLALARRTQCSPLEGQATSVVLRAGRLGAARIRACSDGWPQRSLVVIAEPFEADEPAARQLAIRLLDKGSADQVLVRQELGAASRTVARSEPGAQSGHAGAGNPAGSDWCGTCRSPTG